MESFLQIAPHSLAIVLARIGADTTAASDAAVVSESDELPRHHTGYEIFADFKAENSRQQIWNQRITEAVSEIFFLGWIDEHVLLIQGKEDHLEVLREEWMRRSLNPPRGFTIKYLGDVSPISMSPISQSQFIPLADVLLLAISAINSAQKAVTEEALMEHLQTCFPGVPMPTEEALQHTLSVLVHERKIYPTSDGYFIVTPQTYFITPSLIQTSSKRYYFDERSADRHHHQKQQQNQQTQCTFPLSGTITLATSGGFREQAHSRSTQNHNAVGDACLHNSSYCTDDPPSPHTTLHRPSPKDHREAHSSKHCLQTPPQQTGGNPEKSRGTLGLPFKVDTLTKQRGGIVGVGGTGNLEKQAAGYSTLGRKFGLKLFRLSFKKDKAKQLATFSAQFPPEEWPLHEEEESTHLPRHVEMEIIRRINPDLTVENLARHTAVMKRLEEERTQRSKVPSANQSSRSRRSGGKHRKQSETKPSRPHFKTKAFCFELNDGTHMEQPDRDYRGYSSSLALSPREQTLAVERQSARLHLAHSIPNVLDSSHIPLAPEWDVSGELAKRRMEIPFPEPSHDLLAHHSKVYHSHTHTQERKSRRERSSKAKERSKSVDNSKGPIDAELIGTIDYYNDHNHYYTDNGAVRASQRSFHYTHAAPLTFKGPTDSLNLKGGRNLEKNKTKDSLPAYSPTPLLVSNPTDGYFQCSSNTEVTLTKTNTMGSLGKNNHEELKPSITERRTDRNTFHPTETKEDLPKVLSMPDPSTSNEQLLHSTLSGREKPKESFNKDTFFKPHTSRSLSGCSSLRKATALASITQSSSCNALDSHKGADASKSLVAAQSTSTQVIGSPSSAAVASSDYYNVSDDDELEEGDEGSREKYKRSVLGLERCKAGTMQWLLEREKAINLQRRFERTLTFSGAKENHQEPHQSQLSAHSAILDSMDSSSVTVDSGFNSPRTRESLASNTSSVMEQNRRQTLAVTSDVLEPTSTQPEKTQKPNVCHASITTV